LFDVKYRALRDEIQTPLPVSLRLLKQKGLSLVEEGLSVVFMFSFHVPRSPFLRCAAGSCCGACGSESAC